MEQREEIASRLGPVGKVLTIAANLQELAHTESDAQTSKEVDDDEDVIDVEFVEK